LRSERLSAQKMFGIILGIIGIATIFYPQFAKVDSTHLWAMGLFLIAPIVSAISAIITKRLTKEVAPLMLNAITTSVGCVILGIIALLREPWHDVTFNFTKIWTISYLAIFGTIVTFGIYFRLIKETSAITMTYVAIITPVIAVILGWLILNEQLDYYALAGSSLVICGIAISLRM
jgi:drug/metabolite transporter (DMT)-like permease